jgi:hypothetical protein
MLSWTVRLDRHGTTAKATEQYRSSRHHVCCRSLFLTMGGAINADDVQEPPSAGASLDAARRELHGTASHVFDLYLLPRALRTSRGGNARAPEARSHCTAISSVQIHPTA